MYNHISSIGFRVMEVHDKRHDFMDAKITEVTTASKSNLKNGDDWWQKHVK